MSREHLHEIWGRAAVWRRAVLLVLLLAPTFFAGGYMASVLPYKGTVWHETILVIVFTLLFAWISMGFWTALVGFITLRSKFSRFFIPGSAPETADREKTLSRTAILIPVCNEYPARVFAGIAEDHIITCTAENLIVTRTAVDPVVPVISEDFIGSGISCEEVSG